MDVASQRVVRLLQQPPVSSSSPVTIQQMNDLPFFCLCFCFQNQNMQAVAPQAKAKRKADAMAEKEAGNTAYKKKDFQNAIQHYDRALDLYDEDISFLTNRCAWRFLLFRSAVSCRCWIITLAVARGFFLFFTESGANFSWPR